MLKRSYLLAISILFVTVTLNAQNQSIAEINKRLQSVEEYHKNEEVFLHLSQPSATPGDVIWFSGYVTDIPSHSFSKQSRMLFTKLVNNQGDVVSQSINKINSGKANGSLTIPGTISQGTYKIIAYSSWMKNFSPEHYFSQEFTVQKPQKEDFQMTLAYADSVFRSDEKIKASVFTFDQDGNPLRDVTLTYRVRSSKKVFIEKETESDQNQIDLTFSLPKELPEHSGMLEITARHDNKKVIKRWTIPTQLPKVDVRFFPEGGNFVEGLQNRMAFKATDKKGNPVDIKAALVKNGNTILDTVQTFHNGMGSFGITPVKGNNYILRILEPYSTITEFPLPIPSKSGYLLHVSHKNEDVISIRANGKDISTAKPSYITLDMKGRVLWGEPIRLDSAYTRNLSSKKLPMGIARLTLFNNKLMPQAERLVFLNPDKKLNISLSTAKKSYQARDKVSLEIETQKPNGEPIPASFSLSAYDSNQMAEDGSAKNIVSSLLLDSELRGHIADPNYYFEKNGPERTKALDHLLMIHGWRKISWKKVLSKDANQYTSYRDQDGISGTVLKNGKPVKNADVKLLRLGKNTLFKNTGTDKNGRFTFPSISPTSNNIGKVRVSATTAGGDKNVTIILDKEYKSYKTEQKLQSEYFNFAQPNFSSYLVKNKGEADSTTNYWVRDPNSAYTNINRTLKLDEVVVTGSRLSVEAQEWLEDKRTSNTFSQSISGEELQKANYSSQSAVPRAGQRSIQGIVAMIKEASPVYAIHDNQVLLTPPGTIQGQTGALFIVDGSRAGYNIQNVAYLSVDDIKDITVYDGAGAGKYAFAPGGVIEIQTLHGSDINMNEQRQELASNEAILGSVYTPVREFYSPDHSEKAKKDKEERTKDYRSAIHWEPHIMTNKKGKVSITFYLTDAQTKVKIIANGLTDKGLVGSNEKTISVSN